VGPPGRKRTRCPPVFLGFSDGSRRPARAALRLAGQGLSRWLPCDQTCWPPLMCSSAPFT